MVAAVAFPLFAQLRIRPRQLIAPETRASAGISSHAANTLAPRVPPASIRINPAAPHRSWSDASSSPSSIIRVPIPIGPCNRSMIPASVSTAVTRHNGRETSADVSVIPAGISGTGATSTTGPGPRRPIKAAAPTAINTMTVPHAPNRLPRAARRRSCGAIQTAPASRL